MPYTDRQITDMMFRARNRVLQNIGVISQAYYFITPYRDSLSEFYNYMQVPLPNPLRLTNVDKTASDCAYTSAGVLKDMLMPDCGNWSRAVLNAVVQSKMKNKITQDMITIADQYVHMYIQNSNFYQLISEIFVDTRVGAGAAWVTNTGDKNNPVEIESIPGFSVMPVYYKGGAVRDAFYSFSCSVQYIRDNYFPLSLEVDSYLNGMDSKYYDSVFITRGHLYDPDPANTSKKWRTVDYLTIFADPTAPKAKLSDDYSYDKRLFYIRSKVRPGDCIGIGPGIECLGQVEMLNEMIYDSYRGAKMRNIPTIEADPYKLDYDNTKNLAGLFVPKGTFGNELRMPEYQGPEAFIQYLSNSITKMFTVYPLGDLNQPRIQTKAEVDQRVSENSSTTNAARFINETSKSFYLTWLYRLLRLDIIPDSTPLLAAMEENEHCVSLTFKQPLGDMQDAKDMLALENDAQFAQQYVGAASIPALFQLDKVGDFLKNKSRTPSLYNQGSVFMDHIEEGIKAAQGQAQQGQPGQGAPSGLPTPTTTAQPFQPTQGVGLI